MDSVLDLLTQQTVKSTHALFNGSTNSKAEGTAQAQKIGVSTRYRAEYLASRELPHGMLTQEQQQQQQQSTLEGRCAKGTGWAIWEAFKVKIKEAEETDARLAQVDSLPPPPGQQIVRKRAYEPVRPTWHAPWKLMRVISGHIGWVRALAVEPGNKWFASGSVDRTIKIWDLASGTLKLTLTGHISPVRGLVVSARHPYLFSCGEDKQVKCWDLETNKVVRQYNGHLSGIYSMALHPTLDLLVTGGRDSVARVWDMRTRRQVHLLSGHTSTVSALQCQEADPQIISGSMDSTVKLWDLAAGKSMATLTHHKKSVRALALHPTEFGFLSGSSDNIKQWRGTNSIVNTLSVNHDGVVFSGADNGSMRFWDWKSAYCFQETETVAQPGSLDSEAGIFCSTFDRTGFRLITGEADKTIKIWKEDDEATEESHPVDFKPSLTRRRY
ncbi:pre-mRNA-splicing factor prp46 [Linderina pennispora]|uniref:Pre-mRNA-splicing factor prp46 n=1 Tax=Linderina pennispora TaxID=61395 RepID=A0A1Y1WB27_9FUNG|nr:pre-mRNA-splicing factor prp46 [Linderina pennispora]ORX70733.1 pre-mRNA-splicing factor prp46 [Linderina pennispora]